MDRGGALVSWSSCCLHFRPSRCLRVAAVFLFFVFCFLLFFFASSLVSANSHVRDSLLIFTIYDLELCVIRVKSVSFQGFSRQARPEDFRNTPKHGSTFVPRWSCCAIRACNYHLASVAFVHLQRRCLESEQQWLTVALLCHDQDSIQFGRIVSTELTTVAVCRSHPRRFSR